MPKITFANDWNTTSQSRFGNKVFQNHESSLSEEDIKSLIMSILKLPGMDTPQDENRHEKFKTLTNVLKSDKDSPYIRVTKGIHQRDSTEVHFTFQIAPVGSGEGSYHVFLVSGDLESVKTKDNNGTVELFKYNVSGITYEAKATGNLKWPAAFKKSGLNKPHLTRGTSFSIGNSQAITNPIGELVQTK